MTLMEALESRQFLAAQYTLTLLPPAAGKNDSHAYALNDSGQVVGYSNASPGYVPVLWTVSSAGAATATTLPQSPAGDQIALDINNAGTILYNHYTRTASGTFTKLTPATPATPDDGAGRINNAGMAVGTRGGKVFIWHSDGLTGDTVPIITSAKPWDISDKGTVVGITTTDKGSRPFEYAGGKVTLLPVPADAVIFNQAMAVNNGDVAVGMYTPPSGAHHAALWKNGVFKDLGAQQPADQFSIAYGINDAGTIVGDAGFAWVSTDGATTHDLNTMVNLPAGVKLITAHAINNTGEIIGEANTISGIRAYLLKPLSTPPGGASIAGNVFNDADANSAKNTGESGVANVKIFLDADKDGMLDTGEKTATTDAGGNFKFTGLAAGSYRIREVVPAGYRRTTPSSGYFDVTLAANQAVTGKNFGNTQKVYIAGTLWKDANGNGSKDAGETGLVNWRVFIDADKDGVFDSTERSTLTDASGNYLFSALSAGSYRVREVLPSLWRGTAPSSGFFDLTLASGGSAIGKNFGNTQNVHISGTVFNDANRDASKGTTETGLDGWRVYIDKDGDGAFDAGENSVMTDSSGFWQFRALPAGTYTVRVDPPKGWKLTTPTGGSYHFTLASAASAKDKRFGYARS
jgi:protocatechuate 3,4-dioxygenase beta subunit